MNQPTPHGPRDVIETALTDWWTTTDPSEPFHAPAVAEHVETYLHSHGYVIAPNIPRNPPVPSRRSIATALVIAVLSAVSVVFTARRGDWAWAAAGTIAAAFLIREATRDIRDRRHGRPAR